MRLAQAIRNKHNIEYEMWARYCCTWPHHASRPGHEVCSHVTYGDRAWHVVHCNVLYQEFFGHQFWLPTRILVDQGGWRRLEMLNITSICICHWTLLLSKAFDHIMYKTETVAHCRLLQRRRMKTPHPCVVMNFVDLDCWKRGSKICYTTKCIWASYSGNVWILIVPQKWEPYLSD